jgi:hypothetical protein
MNEMSFNIHNEKGGKKLKLKFYNIYRENRDLVPLKIHKLE